MFIPESELFKGIHFEVIDEIAAFAKEELFPAGHVLAGEGDPAEFLYILQEGQVNLHIPGERPIVFPITKRGSIFGWSAVVEPQRYTAKAEVVVDSKLTQIDGARLLRLLEKHPHDALIIMRRLNGILSARLLECYQRLGAIDVRS